MALETSGTCHAGIPTPGCNVSYLSFSHADAFLGDKNYPWKTRRRNTYDVPLPDGTEDDAYLTLLR